MRKIMIIFLLIIFIFSSIGCQAVSNTTISINKANISSYPSPVTTQETVTPTKEDVAPTVVSSENIFADYNKISSWAKDGVKQAYQRNLMQGALDKNDNKIFCPQGLVTFGEAFTMTLNIINNKNLDMMDCIKKLGYPSVNLWGTAKDYSDNSGGFYYSYADSLKIEDSYRSAHAIGYNWIPETYGRIVLKQSIDVPHFFFKNMTYRQIENGYAEKSVKDQIKQGVTFDLNRINTFADERLKKLFKGYVLYADYFHRLQVVKDAKHPNDYIPSIRTVVNGFDERHYTQTLINQRLYPNLQGKNNWAYCKYDELIRYMYLNGIISEENISFNTPIKKDQFASLMYWTLAVSGQTFDWSGQPPYAIGKYLEAVTSGFKAFMNLPHTMTYVYSGPLNQLKELGIISGTSEGIADYNTNITREQVALIMNRLYDYAKDHKQMKRYTTVNKYKNRPWYLVTIRYEDFNITDKDFPVVSFAENMNFLKNIKQNVEEDNWIGK